jgi:hypothetical protein
MMTHDMRQPVTVQQSVFTRFFVRSLATVTGVTGCLEQIANARVRAHAGLLPNTRHNPSFRHCARAAWSIALPAAVPVERRQLVRHDRVYPRPAPVAGPSGGATPGAGLSGRVLAPYTDPLQGIPTYSRLARPGGAGSCVAIRSAFEEYRLYRPGGCRACDGCHSCAGETRHPFPNGALNDANRQ